jgi:hypothetical protein
MVINKPIVYLEKNVFTALNADKIPIFSKVICSSNLGDIKYKIYMINTAIENRKQDDLWLDNIRTIYLVEPEGADNRFVCDNKKSYPLAYLVFQPDYNQNEDGIKKYYVPWNHESCFIGFSDCVVEKKSKCASMVTGFKKRNDTGVEYITIGNVDYTFKQLFDLFELMDGEPCGNEVSNEEDWKDYKPDFKLI